MPKFGKIGLEDYYGGSANETSSNFTRISRLNPNQTVTLTKPFTWIDSRVYPSFQSALTAIGTSSPTPLLVTNPLSVTTSTLVPTNVGVIFMPGGSLTVNSPSNVVFSSPITLTATSTFLGTGSVSYTTVGGSDTTGNYINITTQPTPVLTTNTGAQNTANMKTIIAAASAGDCLFVPPGTYDFDKDGANDYAILIDGKVLNIIGAGWQSTFRGTGNDYHLLWYKNVGSTTSPGITIKNFRLTRTTQIAYSATHAGYYGGLTLTKVVLANISDLWIDSHGIGIYLYADADWMASSDNFLSRLQMWYNRIGIKYTNTNRHQTDNKFRNFVCYGDGTFTSGGLGYNAGYYNKNLVIGDITLENGNIGQYEEGVRIECTSAPGSIYRVNANLTNVWLDVTKDYGFYFKDIDLIRMMGCSCVGKNPVYLGGVKNAIISNGYFVSLTPTYSAILVEATSSSVGPHLPTFININNNVINANNMGIGIVLNAANLSVVRGNTIEDGIDAIVLHDQTLNGNLYYPYKNTVSDNMIDSIYDGVYVSLSAWQNIVIGNVTMCSGGAGVINSGYSGSIVYNSVL